MELMSELPFTNSDLVKGGQAIKLSIPVEFLIFVVICLLSSYFFASITFSDFSSYFKIKII